MKKGMPVELHCCPSMDGFHDHNTEPNLGWEDDDGTELHLVLYLVVANRKVYTGIDRDTLKMILENNVENDVLIRVSPCPKCALKGITGPRFDLQFDKGED